MQCYYLANVKYTYQTALLESNRLYMARIAAVGTSGTESTCPTTRHGLKKRSTVLGG